MLIIVLPVLLRTPFIFRRIAMQGSQISAVSSDSALTPVEFIQRFNCLNYLTPRKSRIVTGRASVCNRPPWRRKE